MPLITRNIGEYSDHPILEMIINRVEDRGPSVNGITATISASFAPYDLKGGWEKNRNLFVNRVFETIEKYIPGFNNLVKSYELLTPCVSRNNIIVLEDIGTMGKWELISHL